MNDITPDSELVSKRLTCEVVLERVSTTQQRVEFALAIQEWCRMQVDKATIAFIDNPEAIVQLLMGNHARAVCITVSSTWQNGATLAASIDELGRDFIEDIIVDGVRYKGLDLERYS